MSFSLNLVTEISQAETLIAFGQKERKNLDLRKQNLSVRAEHTLESSNNASTDLANTKLMLDASNAIIASLPDGPKKEDEITTKMELEVKIRKLTFSVAKADAISKLENEFEIDQLERQIAGIDEFIAAVTARKTELGG